MEPSPSPTGILDWVDERRFTTELDLECPHQVADLAWTLLPDGPVEFVTRSYLRRTGQSLEACQAHPDLWNFSGNALPPLLSTVHPEHADRVAQGFWKGMRSGQGWSIEAPFRGPECNRYRWCLIRVQAVRDRFGVLRRFTGSHTDIDDLRQARGKTTALFEISNAIDTMLRSSPTSDAVCAESIFPVVCGALSRVVALDWAQRSLFRSENNSFEVVAASEARGLQDLNRERRLFLDHSSVGWVFEHCRPTSCGDLGQGAQYEDEHQLASQGLISYAAISLLHRGECRGVLRVASGLSAAFLQADLDFLCEVSRQIALALENQKVNAEITELKATLELESSCGQEESRREHDFEGIIGNSRELLKLLDRVEAVAPTEASVLIVGETGTGKELIARAIHSRSARKRGSLVKVNCGAIPSGLVESELFGHMEGAFTSASERRIGRFELANGGTIFLDEVGELPLETQVKLLRVLQEREFEPVGSSKTVQVNVRIIAATNRDLAAAVQAGTFRSDLYYRLNEIPLQVQPLRSRKSDIPEIVDFFLQQSAAKMNKQVRSVSRDTMRLLVEHAWPGNIRELQNVIERGVVLCKRSVLRLGKDLLPVEIASDVSSETLTRDFDELGTLEEVQRDHIRRVLEKTDRVVSGPRGAATILGMNPNTLHSLMKRLGIRRSSIADQNDARRYVQLQEIG